MPEKEVKRSSSFSSFVRLQGKLNIRDDVVEMQNVFRMFCHTRYWLFRFPMTASLRYPSFGYLVHNIEMGERTPHPG